MQPIHENPLPSQNLFRGISSKALGILFYLVISDSRISAEIISQTLSEGESAIASGLRELRNKGWLQLTTMRSKDGTFLKSTSITTEGYQFIASAFAKIDPYNSHFLHLFYDAKHADTSAIGKFIPRPSGETYSVVDPSGYEGPTAEELRLKALETEEEKREALKKFEKEKEMWVAKELGKRRAQFKARSLKPDKRTWTPTDISFEFGDRVNQIWQIPPWTVTQTRFRMILADKRRRHDTNGLIECAMIDVFFEKGENFAQKDGDYIMMRFFYFFRSLLETVKMRGLGLTDEEKAELEAEQQRLMQLSMRKLFDIEE